MTTKRNTRNPGRGPLRAITYGRVSTGRQAIEGLSLGDQADTLAAEVARRGWTHVAHVIDAGMSGRNLDRRNLAGVLDRLDRGEADVLLASKCDRLARSTADLARLLDRAERRGWQVTVLDVSGVDTTQAAGRLVVEVVGAAAAFESRRIGERVRSAHAVRRARGERAGQAPILPAALRRRIAGERAAGRSLQAIADALNVEGMPTARGGTWHASTVAHVVRSVALDAELAERSGSDPEPAAAA
jgi:DNA invertase Pin-like site-specific DNA recombinase